MSSYQNFYPRGGPTGQVVSPNVFGVPSGAQMAAGVAPGAAAPVPMPAATQMAAQAPQGMQVPAGQGIAAGSPLPQGAQMSAAGAAAGNRLQLSPEALAALRSVAMRGVPMGALPGQGPRMPMPSQAQAFAGQQRRMPPAQAVPFSLADLYRTQGVPRR